MLEYIKHNEQHLKRMIQVCDEELDLLDSKIAEHIETDDIFNVVFYLQKEKDKIEREMFMHKKHLAQTLGQM